MLGRLAMEPPLRVFVRAALNVFPVSVTTRAMWELSARPAYLLGLHEAAVQARREGRTAISAFEFGVAGGNGLLSLQADAEAVGRAFGISINVYGFDVGRAGMPSGTGDHRDHPDKWRAGDFPMDEDALRKRLAPATQLVLGDVRETVPRFFTECSPPPIGFVAIDLDFYSSTRDALRLFALPDSTMLNHVPMYFDDIDLLFNHRFAGELLAIDEFNAQNQWVKIDRWHGVREGRPFPERGYFDKMFVAHNLKAASFALSSRPPVRLPLAGRRMTAATTR